MADKPLTVWGGAVVDVRSPERFAEREAIYRRVVADLHLIGYGALADELEFEADVLYGKPGALTPLGILTHPAVYVVVPALPSDGEEGETFLPPAYPDTIAVIEPIGAAPTDAEWAEARERVLAKIRGGDFNP